MIPLVHHRPVNWGTTVCLAVTTWLTAPQVHTRTKQDRAPARNVTKVTDINTIKFELTPFILWSFQVFILFNCRVPFPLGYYCDFANRPLTDYTPYPCPVGHYCPNGTEYAQQHKCPAGTYNPVTKLESVSACTKCDPGKYCSGTGKTTTTGK